MTEKLLTGTWSLNTNKQTKSSPTVWLRMRIWRMNLRRTKSAKILWRTQAFFMQRAKTDQIGQMPRLIWVFAGHTVTLLVLSWVGSYVFFVFVFFRGQFNIWPWSGECRAQGQIYTDHRWWNVAGNNFFYRKISKYSDTRKIAVIMSPRSGEGGREEAYWFWSVCACVWLLRFAYGQ